MCGGKEEWGKGGSGERGEWRFFVLGVDGVAGSFFGGGCGGDGGAWGMRRGWVGEGEMGRRGRRAGYVCVNRLDRRSPNAINDTSKIV